MNLIEIEPIEGFRHYVKGSGLVYHKAGIFYEFVRAEGVSIDTMYIKKITPGENVEFITIGEVDKLNNAPRYFDDTHEIEDDELRELGAAMIKWHKKYLFMKEQSTRSKEAHQRRRHRRRA